MTATGGTGRKARGSGEASKPPHQRRQQRDEEGAGAGAGPGRVEAGEAGRGAGRERRAASGSSSSSGSSPVELSWDPPVAGVLLRMSRELQGISRQLELMERILLSQQRLIHANLETLVPSCSALTSDAIGRE